MGLVGIGDSEGSVSIPSDISNTSIALKARKERVPYVLWSSILTFLVDHQCTLNYWVHGSPSQGTLSTPRHHCEKGLKRVRGADSIYNGLPIYTTELSPIRDWTFGVKIDLCFSAQLFRICVSIYRTEFIHPFIRC